MQLSHLNRNFLRKHRPGKAPSFKLNDEAALCEVAVGRYLDKLIEQLSALLDNDCLGDKAVSTQLTVYELTVIQAAAATFSM